MGKKEVAAIGSICVIPISVFVNRIVPDPCMDEIFCTAQVLQHRNGNFRSWDPMVTTPPGLQKSREDPAPLITIPFQFLMLHSHVDSYLSLPLLGILYTVLNIFTMGMFFYWPFHWNHEPGVQRFIW